MSRNSSVNVIEPHPTVPKSGGYVGGGRGGAGNFRRYIGSDLSSAADATGPASLVLLSKPVKRTAFTGRGGAGNMFRPDDSEEALFKFDEEMSRRHEAPAAPVYRVGRGGAGNTFDGSRERSSRTGSTGSSASVSSGGSDVSVRRSLEGALGKISRKFSARS